MNQTTWIIGGGIVIVAIAGALFFLTGDGFPKMGTPAPITKTTMSNQEQTTASTTATTTSVAPTSKEATPATVATKQAIIKTSMGDITVKFYDTDAPKTVANFEKLAKEGFYNGTRFHRVIKGFMIQGGDPLSKDDAQAGRWGTGGPGYKFEDEIVASSAIYQKGYKPGVLAMANAGPNTNGSQFFIMAADYPLPPLYTIFGEVTSGLDVVMSIDEVKTLPGDRPETPVTINAIDIN